MNEQIAELRRIVDDHDSSTDGDFREACIADAWTTVRQLLELTTAAPFDVAVAFGDGTDDDTLRALLGHLVEGQYIVELNGRTGRLDEVAPGGRWAIAFQPYRHDDNDDLVVDGEPEWVWLPAADGAPPATPPIHLVIN